MIDATFFDTPLIRTGTASEKWDGIRWETGDPDMLPMWVADMDFRSPPAVQEAIARVAAQGTWGYTEQTPEDKACLIGYWQRRHGVQIAPEQVLLSPCVVSSLRLCVRALSRHGDGVLVNPPIYGPFFSSVTDNGRRLVPSPLVLDEEGSYRLNLPEMEQKLQRGEAQLVLFCSPHNPCGRCWSREEIAAVAALCARCGVPLVVDEIHADFVYAPRRFTSVLSLPEAGRVVQLSAASKTFNIAGLRLSAILSRDAESLQAMEREMRACGVVSGTPFALAATRAAYAQGEEWLAALLPYLKANVEAVQAHVRSHWPRVRLTPTEATYLLWLDCRALGLSQEELMARTHAAHVALTDGLFFGEQGRGFLRLNIACPRAQLKEALVRLDAVFA